MGWHIDYGYRWLAPIPANDLHVCRPSNEKFSNNQLVCKNNRTAKNDIFSNFLWQMFLCLREGMEFCICSIVWTKGGEVWWCTTKLQHIDIFVVVKKHFFSHYLLSWDNIFVVSLLVHCKNYLNKLICSCLHICSGNDNSQFQLVVALIISIW